MPQLSSTNRVKHHYRGRAIGVTTTVLRVTTTVLGAFPNDSVRRQAIQQGPCWTRPYVFSELHSTDIGALFFLYIR